MSFGSVARLGPGGPGSLPTQGSHRPVRARIRAYGSSDHAGRGMVVAWINSLRAPLGSRRVFPPTQSAKAGWFGDPFTVFGARRKTRAGLFDPRVNVG